MCHIRVKALSLGPWMNFRMSPKINCKKLYMKDIPVCLPTVSSLPSFVSQEADLYGLCQMGSFACGLLAVFSQWEASLGNPGAGKRKAGVYTSLPVASFLCPRS